ncbi:hypothetical protein NY08_3144 [Rhodococcus sp. B7740]|nr:hypothetical protein NY08_3144 [Rhodococcus sp. B7740]
MQCAVCLAPSDRGSDCLDDDCVSHDGSLSDRPVPIGSLTPRYELAIVL